MPWRSSMLSFAVDVSRSVRLRERGAATPRGTFTANTLASLLQCVPTRPFGPQTLRSAKRSIPKVQAWGGEKVNDAANTCGGCDPRGHKAHVAVPPFTFFFVTTSRLFLSSCLRQAHDTLSAPHSPASYKEQTIKSLLPEYVMNPTESPPLSCRPVPVRSAAAGRSSRPPPVSVFFVLNTHTHQPAATAKITTQPSEKEDKTTHTQGKQQHKYQQQRGPFPLCGFGRGIERQLNAADGGRFRPPPVRVSAPFLAATSPHAAMEQRAPLHPLATIVATESLSPTSLLVLPADGVDRKVCTQTTTCPARRWLHTLGTAHGAIEGRPFHASCSPCG